MNKSATLSQKEWIAVVVAVGMMLIPLVPYALHG